MTGQAGPRIAVLRPADDRIETAVSILEELGAVPVADPMLQILPTGEVPRSDADFVILTSTTAADLLETADWTPGAATVCAIGPRTSAALEEVGIGVSVVPDTFDSAGMVKHLDAAVDGARIEIARSDHGSDVLPDGISQAGGYVHETILYALERPPGAGRSINLIAAGELDGILFTSRLTVEHFLETAAELDDLVEVKRRLGAMVVGAIGSPTVAALERKGIRPGVVPSDATFEDLAIAVVEQIRTTA